MTKYEIENLIYEKRDQIKSIQGDIKILKQQLINLKAQRNKQTTYKKPKKTRAIDLFKNSIDYIRNSFERGKSSGDIANELGLELGTFKAYCGLFNIKIPRKRNLKRLLLAEKCQNMQKRGLTYKEIASELNISVSSIGSLLAVWLGD
jgi:DNA-binding NarL/FixJ family response regulator